MAADGLAARRAVREHLEANFDEYLSSVSDYLRQAYPDLQLSSEMSEEIAATVIVRVSHSDAETADIETALCKSADDVVRSRRPRLSQAKLLDEVNGPLRPEYARALPSLRLVQSFSRAPAVTSEAEPPEVETGGPLEPDTRLVLANPPLDLGASLGDRTSLVFDAAKPTEHESRSSDAAPALGAADGPEVMPFRATSPSRQGSAASDAADEDMFEFGAWGHVQTASDAPADATLAHVEAVPHDEGDGPAHGIVRPRAATSNGETEHPSADSAGATSDATILGAALAPDMAPDMDAMDHAFWSDDDSEPVLLSRRSEPAPEQRLPTVSHELDGFDEDFENPASAGDGRPPTDGGTSLSSVSHEIPAAFGVSAPASAVTRSEDAAREATFDAARAEGAAMTAQERSSVAPAQESTSPSPKPRTGAGRAAGETEAPRTRRKSTKRAKKTSTKTRATRTKQTQPKRSPSQRQADQTRERPPAAPAGAFVADDLAVLAMLGFPSNSRRAAMLCVTAVSEELGLEGHVDLTPFVAQVMAALDELRRRFEQSSPMPPDAHLQWQRIARQATLRAFLSVGK